MQGLVYMSCERIHPTSAQSAIPAVIATYGRIFHSFEQFVALAIVVNVSFLLVMPAQRAGAWDPFENALLGPPRRTLPGHTLRYP